MKNAGAYILLATSLALFLAWAIGSYRDHQAKVGRADCLGKGGKVLMVDDGWVCIYGAKGRVT